MECVCWTFSPIPLCVRVDSRLFSEEPLCSANIALFLLFHQKLSGLLRRLILIRFFFFHKVSLYSTPFSWFFRGYSFVCKWLHTITVSPLLVRDHNLKFTAARYLSDTWLRKIIFMEDGLEEMQSSILPYNLKSISGLRETIRELPDWTHTQPSTMASFWAVLCYYGEIFYEAQRKIFSFALFWHLSQITGLF